MRGCVRAAARLTVDAGPAGPRVRWTHAWPVVLRRTGPDRVHLVHAAGGPLGGDELGLEVDVGAGAGLAVRSAGATLVQPGAGPAAGVPARWSVTARVGPGARLDWAPEPTVVTDGAAIRSTLRVALAAGSAATVREVVVLGRHGQRGGRHTGGLEVVVGGRPLLAHTTVLDGADPALRGPAGTAGARAVGTLVRVGHGAVPAEPDGGASSRPGGGGGRPGSRPGGAAAGETPDVRWAWTPLPGPGALLVAVGTPAAVAAALDGARDADLDLSLDADPEASLDVAAAAGVPRPAAARA